MNNENILVVDFSSVVGAYLHLKDTEFGEDIEYKGQSFHIPDTQTSLETFQKTVANMDFEPVNMIVVKDPGGVCKARTRILREYKQKPRISPPEFHDARKALFEEATVWLKSLGAIVATPKNGTEADDLINQIVIRIPNCTVWTRDKDMLATPGNVILQGRGGDSEFNPERFPVQDQFIPVYRAIVSGDASDNVGSCKGFGDAAWAKMIEEFGLDVVDDLDEMFRKEDFSGLKDYVSIFPKFQMMIDQADDIITYYKVMSFLPVPAHEVKWEGGMLKGTSLLVTANIFDAVHAEISKTKFSYATIDYESDTCQESRDWCAKNGIKVDVMGQEITGMGLRIGSKNWYFSVDHADTNNTTIDQLESILELLWGKRIYAHNAGFENTLTYNHFGVLLPNIVDTQLMASYVDENDFTNLKHLSSKNLGYRQATFAETLGDRSGMREVSGEEVVGYGIDDVITTDALANLFEVIMQYEGTLDVFHQVEDDALYYTTMCFINGVKFNEEAYHQLKTLNDANTKESWGSLSDNLLKLGWEGGEFTEVKSLSIGMINKIHKAIHGEELDGSFTTAAAGIRSMEDRRLAEMLETKNYPLLNEYYHEHWVPGAEFNVRSPKQMSKLLYETLELPVRLRNKPTANMIKAGKKGNPTANESAVENAIAWKDASGDEANLLNALITYKGYLTKESLFLSKYPNYVHWKTGRIHASLRQSATTTRRFSCSAPNFQQLPKRKGKEYRDMLMADEGYELFAFDFTGQELCIAADDSRDPAFLACYIGDNKKDVHALTGLEIANNSGHNWSYEEFKALIDSADEIPEALSWIKASTGAETFEGFAKSGDYFLLSEDEKGWVAKGLEYFVSMKESKSLRTLGKKVNFTAQFGCRAPKLGHELCIPVEDAQTYLNSREAAFPRLLERVEEWHKICRGLGHAKTMLGARRHLAGHQCYGSKKDFEKQATDRLAYSMRIQGSASEMTKLVMAELYRRGLFDDGDTLETSSVKPLTMVHDELLVQVRYDRRDELAVVIRDVMCQKYADMIITMTTQPECGKTFGSLKKWAPLN